MHAAARNIIPAKKLRALPATQIFFSTAEAIASSPCNLLRKERIPSKENPKASVNRLMPVEVCLGFLDIGSDRQKGNLNTGKKHPPNKIDINNTKDKRYNIINSGETRRRST
jgi:hypothetical protein